MHEYGINVRYLGYLRANVTQNSSIQRLILVTMISRVVKNYLRAKMRQITATGDDVFKKVIVDYFNLILGTSSTSTFYWTSEVKLFLLAKFDSYGSSLTDKERDSSY